MKCGAMLLASCLVAFAGVLSAIGWLWTVTNVFLLLVFGLSGILLGAALVLTSGKKYVPAGASEGSTDTHILFKRMMVRCAFFTCNFNLFKCYYE